MNSEDCAARRPLIGLRGRKHSGKDTVAGYLIDEYGYTRCALADPLKRQHYESLVYSYTMHSREPLPPELRTFDAYLAYCEAHKHDDPSEQTSWPRLAWQAHGSAMRDLFGDDYWLRQATLADGYVLTDVRMPNEIDAVHAAGGVVWLLRRADAATSDRHASEIYADDLSLPYDIWLDNDGSLRDLRRAVTIAYGVTLRMAALPTEQRTQHLVRAPLRRCSISAAALRSS